jgi:hypothetical protein
MPNPPFPRPRAEFIAAALLILVALVIAVGSLFEARAEDGDGGQSVGRYEPIGEPFTMPVEYVSPDGTMLLTATAFA